MPRGCCHQSGKRVLDTLQLGNVKHCGPVQQQITVIRYGSDYTRSYCLQKLQWQALLNMWHEFYVEM